MSVFVSVLSCFDYYSFVVFSEAGKVMHPAVFFFLRIALTVALWFHINYRIICFSSVKNIMGILIRIALNL